MVVASALTSFAALSSGLAAPIAHADPLDDVRGAVIAARANTGCPPLNYNVQLEAAAQAWVRGGPRPSDNPSLGYDGFPAGVEGLDAHASKATNAAISDLNPSLKDCTFKDFGVGMVRDDALDESDVAVVLGRPPAPAAPAQQNAPANTPRP
jgi:hypothetical protein